MAGAVEAYLIAGEAGPSRASSNALSAVAFEDPLVHRVKSSLSPGASVTRGGGGPVLVDSGGSLSHGGSFRDACSDLHLYSDASRSGWGAHHLYQSVSRVWSVQESSLHINLLEMKALFLALQSFQ